MHVVIVDTDVVSYIFKRDTRAALYEPHLVSALASISFMTVAELEQWAIRHKWGSRRYGEMLSMLKNRFSVIDSSRSLCRKWAEIREEVRGTGRVIQRSDAWIAATAVIYGVPLITHNTGHFIGISGLTVISESEPR